MFAFNVFLKRGILSRGGRGWAWGQYVQPGGHCRERRRATSCLFVYIGGSGHWQKHNTLNASTLQNKTKKERKCGRSMSTTATKTRSFSLNAVSRVNQKNANVKFLRRYPALMFAVSLRLEMLKWPEWLWQAQIHEVQAPS